MGGLVEGGTYGSPPQGHPLGPDPSSDGEATEEVDLVDSRRKVSGHPYTQ
jgi:hypothetical protein